MLMRRSWLKDKKPKYYVKGNSFQVMAVTSGKWWTPLKKPILIEAESHMGVFKGRWSPKKHPQNEKTAVLWRKP